MNLADFHFLRPDWWWCLPVLLALLWWLARAVQRSRSWEQVCDPELLPYLLSGARTGKRRHPLAWIAVAGALVITALAGPTWEKLPQPLFRDSAALVVALDLSRSMDAEDVKPSRLSRAKHKISDILEQRQDGQSALLVYAEDAFVVTPLTDDNATIAAQLPALDSGLMPRQGSRTDRALGQALRLLQQAGSSGGTVLLITDGIALPESRDAIQALRDEGHRVSVLGIGTREGGPIPVNGGGFLKDAGGDIVIPRLDGNALRQTAQTGGGRFAELRADDGDIRALLPAQRGMEHAEPSGQRESDQWRELGPWLLLLLLPVAALAFRRGVIASVLLVCLPYPGTADAMDWSALWQNQDQRAGRALERGDADRAAELFSDPEWKAAARYRAGDFEAAATTLEGIESADAHYNRGNALARTGRLPDAMASYEQALERDPGHEDARHNLELLQQATQQDGQEGQPDQGGEQDQQTGQEGTADRQGTPQSETGGSNPATPQQGEGAQSDSGTRPQDRTDDARQEDAMTSEPRDTPQAESPTEPPVPARDSAEQPEQDATEQWLRAIPDDPGGLLRRKFLYQYQQRGHDQDKQEPAW